MKSTNEKKKTISIQYFYQTFIEVMLKHQISLGIFKYCAIFIEFAQILSFMFTFQKEEQVDEMKWYEGYKIVFYIVRPSLILLHNKLERLNMTFFLIILIVNLMFIALTILMVIYRNGVRQLSNLVISVMILVSTYYNSVMVVMNYEVLQLLILQGGFNVFSNAEEVANTGVRLVSVVLLVIQFIYSVICCKFTEQSLSIIERNLMRIESTNLHLVSVMMKLVITFCYCYDVQGKTFGSVAVTSITILITAINIIDFIGAMPFAEYPKGRLYLACYTSCLTVAVMNMLYQIINAISSQTFLTYTLLILPVFVKFCDDRWISMRDKIVFCTLYEEKLPSQQDIKILNRKISFLYVNQDYILEHDYIKILAMLDNHSEGCQDQYCFCKTKSIVTGHDGTNYLLSCANFDRYLRLLIRFDIDRTNFQQNLEKQIHFIRYIDYVSKSKKHTYAMYKIIEFFNETNRMSKQTSTFIEIVLKSMLQIVKHEMQYSRVSSIKEPKVEAMVRTIDLFIRMNIEETELKRQLQEALVLKVETLEQMRKIFETTQDLEDVNFRLNEKLDKTERRGLKFYNDYPTKKNQALLCYFESEIKGNLKLANSIQQSCHYSENLDLLSSKQNIMDIFSQQVLSLTVCLGKVWGKIVSYSDKLPLVLGYKKQEMSYINHIRELMPPTIAKMHDDLIRFLLYTGEDYIVHTRREIFLKTKQNFLIKVEVFVDINVYYPDEMPYIFFLRGVPTQSGHLIVSRGGYVEGLDSEIINKVGLTEIKSLPPFFQFDVKIVFPDFTCYMEALNNDKEIYFEKKGVVFQFPNRQHHIYQNIFCQNRKAQKIMVNERENSINGTQSLKRINTGQSHSQQNLYRYKADIFIEKRCPMTIVGPFIYYIVEVRRIYKVSGFAADQSQAMLTSRYTLDQPTETAVQIEEVQEKINLVQESIIKDTAGPHKFGFTEINMEKQFQVGINEHEYLLLKDNSGQGGSPSSILQQKNDEYFKDLEDDQDWDEGDDDNESFSRYLQPEPGSNKNDLSILPSIPGEGANENQVANPFATQLPNHPDNQNNLLADATFETNQVSSIQEEVIRIEGNLHSTRNPQLKNAEHEDEEDVSSIKNEADNNYFPTKQNFYDSFNNYSQFQPNGQVPNNDESFNNNNNNQAVPRGNGGGVGGGHNILSEINNEQPSALQTSNLKINIDQSQIQLLLPVVGGRQENDKAMGLQTLQDNSIDNPRQKNGPKQKLDDNQGNKQKQAPIKNKENGQASDKGQGNNQKVNGLSKVNGQVHQSNGNGNVNVNGKGIGNSKINGKTKGAADKKNIASNGAGKSKNDEQEKIDLKEMLRKEDMQSVTSSQEGFSKTLDKFGTYENFINSKSFPMSLSMIYVLRFFEYLALLITTIASLLIIYQSFDTLLKNIDGLTLESDLIQPYGNFIAQMANWRNLQIYDVSYTYNTAVNKDMLVTTVYLRMNEQFNLYSNNLHKSFSNPYLTDIFTEKNLIIQDIYSETNAAQQQFTLQSVANQLLQYMQKIMNYTRGQLEYESYSQQFVLKNFLNLNEFCRLNNDEIITKTLDYNNQLINNILLLTVILNIIMAIVFSLSLYNFYKFQMLIKSLLRLATSTTIPAVEKEIGRLKTIQDSIKDNEDSIFQFTFSMKQKENDIILQDQNQENLHQSNAIGGSKRKKMLVSIQHEKLSYWRFFLFTLFSYLIFFTYSIVNFALNVQFLESFKPAIEYYEIVSGANEYLTNLYGYKAIIENKVFKDNREEVIRSNYNNTLKNILAFQNLVPQIQQIDFFDEAMQSQILQMANSDLCEQFDDKRIYGFCQNVWEGVLQRGVISTMSQWHSQFKLQMEMNYDSKYQNMTEDLYQSQVIYIISQGMHKIRKSLYDQLSQITQTEKQVVLLLSIIYIILVTIPHILDFTTELQAIVKRYQMAKKLIFLIPTSTLLIEETYLKMLKAIMKKENLK